MWCPCSSQIHLLGGWAVQGSWAATSARLWQLGFCMAPGAGCSQFFWRSSYLEWTKSLRSGSVLSPHRISALGFNLPQMPVGCAPGPSLHPAAWASCLVSGDSPGPLSPGPSSFLLFLCMFLPSPQFLVINKTRNSCLSRVQLPDAGSVN